jgi:diguanylate cyclase (GGDEF)-like protein/PAS domain S-box-containing protein
VAPDAIAMALRERPAQSDEIALGAVLHAVPFMVIVVDNLGRIRGTNRAFERITGRTTDECRAAAVSSFLIVEDAILLDGAILAVSAGGEPAEIEVRLQQPHGPALAIRMTIVNLLDEHAVSGLVIAAVDISQLTSAREQMHHLLSHDDLTGLPNRMALRAGLAAFRADGRDLTILFGDVDGLKPVNDRHGHRAGDAVLVAVALRLRQVVRPDDIVARVSGDEFVVLLATRNDDAVDAICARIEASMTAPITLPNGSAVSVGISVGRAPFEPRLDLDEILAAADAAMYVSKQSRRSRHAHDGHRHDIRPT